MKIFLDSADIDEIKELNKSNFIDGVTTNPSLIAKSGKNILEVIKEICGIVKGPVSAEVTATDYSTMILEANKLPAKNDRDLETKEEAVKNANELAFETPYHIASLCAEVLSLCVDLSKDGNPSSISDVGVAAESAYAGFKGATMNVLINMPNIENNDFKNNYNSPGDIFLLNNFFAENTIDLNISIDDFLKMIIDKSLYKKNFYIKNNLSYFLELYFNKKISYIKSKDKIFYLYKYFLSKIYDSNKYNLDIENVLIKFNGKIING